MNKFFKLYKVILQIFFLYCFVLTNSSISLEKIYKGDSVSNYFSGIIAFKEHKYGESNNFFRNLQNLENHHSKFSQTYIESLINNGKINEAVKYADKLKRKKINFFSSDIVVISKFLKNEEFNKAYNYSISVDQHNYTLLQNLISQITLNWTKIEKSKLDHEQANDIFKNLSPRFKNIKKINNVFLKCYFDSKNLKNDFQNLINDQTADFSRYTFFYVDYLLKKNFKKEANFILNSKLKETPRNLLLNQQKFNLSQEKKNYLKNNFNCKNISHIIAELYYITANALSSQSLYSLSNFYINLAKYMNQDFLSYNTLLAENYLMIENYQEAKKIYLFLKKTGDTFGWHASKQIAFIDINENNIDRAHKTIMSSYEKLKQPNPYQTYDFANFLKNNEKFEKSLKYYSEVLKNISRSHELYPKAKDGRGIAYERSGEWKKAQKDFLDSLREKPEQAYVINYLAYSWIEKGVKLQRSLKMLKEANRLKSNDGFITDSLGWALYKMKKYKEAKEYLKKAVQLMPSDPIVNDHFADSLWMNGNKIQARYYWEYVLNLENTEKKLKDKIMKKIINGPNSLN